MRIALKAMIDGLIFEMLLTLKICTIVIGVSAMAIYVEFAKKEISSV